MKETVVDSLLRSMRLRKVLPYIRRYSNCVMLDVGCGWEARLVRAAEPYVAFAEGVDFKAPELSTPKLRTRKLSLLSTLPFNDVTFDVVTMLAVLEHLEDPEGVVAEVFRVLKPGGLLMMTVPSNASQPVLEFLAFTLHVISEEEIRDHKRYYNRRSLVGLLDRNGFHVERHRYFQFGMNNFAVARKP